MRIFNNWKCIFMTLLMSVFYSITAFAGETLMLQNNIKDEESNPPSPPFRKGGNKGFSDETSILKGRVMDVEGKAVEGVEIYIYKNSNVKRPADFISAGTDKDGRFQVVLPDGKYWAVARLKKGERYGPLMPGDKHSGEPVEIELVSGQRLNKDFTVADIREAARLMKKTRKDFVRIRGRIIDKNGMPVKGAYAVADKNKDISQMPDFISAWTSDDGYYSIYLPRGRYYIGAAAAFPPESDFSMDRDVVIDNDKTGLDIVGKTDATEDNKTTIKDGS